MLVSWYSLTWGSHGSVLTDGDPSTLGFFMSFPYIFISLNTLKAYYLKVGFNHKMVSSRQWSMRSYNSICNAWSLIWTASSGDVARKTIPEFLLFSRKIMKWGNFLAWACGWKTCGISRNLAFFRDTHLVKLLILNVHLQGKKVEGKCVRGG